MARPTSRAGAKKEFRSLIFPSGMEVEGEVKLKVSETPTERNHRHRMEVRRFWIEEAPINLTAIGIAVSGTIAALVLTFRPNSTFQDRQWSFSVLSHLLIAVAGFAFGKAAK